MKQSGWKIPTPSYIKKNITYTNSITTRFLLAGVVLHRTVIISILIYIHT